MPMFSMDRVSRTIVDSISLLRVLEMVIAHMQWDTGLKTPSQCVREDRGSVLALFSTSKVTDIPDIAAKRRAVLSAPLTGDQMPKMEKLFEFKTTVYKTEKTVGHGKRNKSNNNKLLADETARNLIPAYAGWMLRQVSTGWMLIQMPSVMSYLQAHKPEFVYSSAVIQPLHSTYRELKECCSNMIEKDLLSNPNTSIFADDVVDVDRMVDDVGDDIDIKRPRMEDEDDCYDVEPMPNEPSPTREEWDDCPPTSRRRRAPAHRCSRRRTFWHATRTMP